MALLKTITSLSNRKPVLQGGQGSGLAGGALRNTLGNLSGTRPIDFPTTNPGHYRGGPTGTDLVDPKTIDYTNPSLNKPYKLGRGLDLYLGNAGANAIKRGENAEKLAGVFRSLGMKNLADAAELRAARLKDRGQKMIDWEPGKIINTAKEKVGEVVNNALNKGVNTIYNATDTARTRAAEGLWGEGGILKREYDDWGNYVRGLNTDTHVTDALNPGKESMAGEYYSGFERKGMDTLQNLMDARNSIGQDIVGLKRQFEGQKTPLEESIDRYYQQAVSGGLTDPQSEYFQNQSKVLDTQMRKTIDMAKENLAGQGALWGGRQDQAIQDIMNEYGDKKMALFSDLQQKNAADAANYLLGNKQNTTNLTNIAANAMSDVNRLMQSSADSALQHTSRAASDMNAKLGLKLNEQQQNIANAFKKAELLGDLAKTKTNANQAERQLVANNVNNAVNTGTNAIGTIGTLLRNIFASGEQNNDSNDTIKTLMAMLGG